VGAYLFEVRAYLAHIGARLKYGTCDTVNEGFNSIEPCVCLVKSLFDVVEPLFDAVKPLLNTVKPNIDSSETFVYSVANLIDAFEQGIKCGSGDIFAHAENDTPITGCKQELVTEQNKGRIN